MVLRRLFALLFAATLALAASAQTTITPSGLGFEIDRVLDDEAFEGAIWGVYIMDPETGEVLYERNAELPLIPASNMKLVTTAAALDELGPEYHFRTRLYYHGDVSDGVLTGGLTIRGGGDPRFGGRRDLAALDGVFEQWADSLKAHGIRSVQGSISLADDAIAQPAAHFVSRMRRVLRAEGISLEARETIVLDQAPVYRTLTRAAIHDSPPLAAFVTTTNESSNNMYAERILRTLTANLYPSMGPAPAIFRAEAATPFLLRVGVNPRHITVADGSGLSRDNRMTPIGIAGILQGMWEHPDPRTSQAFMGSLPLGGRTGTLRRRFTSGDARNNVRAKTGYISRVRTLSGYVATANGRQLVFSLMCNGYTVSKSRVNRAQDEVVELLADYEGHPIRLRNLGERFGARR